MHSYLFGFFLPQKELSYILQVRNQLKQLQKLEGLTESSGLKGPIRTHDDICSTRTVLYQLRYEVNLELS